MNTYKKLLNRCSIFLIVLINSVLILFTTFVFIKILKSMLLFIRKEREGQLVFKFVYYMGINKLCLEVLNDVRIKDLKKIKRIKINPYLY